MREKRPHENAAAFPVFKKENHSWTEICASSICSDEKF